MINVSTVTTSYGTQFIVCDGDLLIFKYPILRKDQCILDAVELAKKMKKGLMISESLFHISPRVVSSD